VIVFRRGLITIITVSLICLAISTSVRAADQPDPTGTWKWTIKNGEKDVPFTLKLKFVDNKLTGTLQRDNKREVEIEDASLTDNEVVFSATKNSADPKTVIKYKGRINEDVLTGTIESNRGGRTTTLDWEAKREKN
jgi:hypothetical protein